MEFNTSFQLFFLRHIELIPPLCTLRYPKHPNEENYTIGGNDSIVAYQMSNPVAWSGSQVYQSTEATASNSNFRIRGRSGVILTSFTIRTRVSFIFLAITLRRGLLYRWWIGYFANLEHWNERCRHVQRGEAGISNQPAWVVIAPCCNSQNAKHQWRKVETSRNCKKQRVANQFISCLGWHLSTVCSPLGVLVLCLWLWIGKLGKDRPVEATTPRSTTGISSLLTSKNG